MNESHVILIRHGHPEGHEGRCVGHYETELSQEGRLAVAEFASQWPGGGGTRPNLVVTSDLRRAVQSARIIADRWGATLQLDPRLREVNFGDWDGRLWTDISQTDGERMRDWGADWVNVRPPGGESATDVARRASIVLSELLSMVRDGSCDVAVVSHAGWIRVAATGLLGEPLSEAFSRSIDYARAAVFALEDGVARLARWNVEAVA